MADVTVNIRGDSSQLRDELNNIGGTSNLQPEVTRGSSIPSNDRMIEDVRREMQQRGILMVPGSSSMSQIINQYGQSTKNAINERISERYDARREDMRRRAGIDYDAIDADIENKKRERMQSLGDNANDPLYRTILEQQLEQDRNNQYRVIGSRYDREEQQLNQEEANERVQAESELTDAIRELTEHFDRESQGEDSDSYIGRLRARQRELYQQRDTADSEEGAMAASRSIAEVNEKLRRAMSGGESQQGSAIGLKGLQMGLGATNVISSLQGGNMGGAIMGGAIMTGNPYIIAAAAAAAGVANIAKNISGTFESLSGLAAYRGTTGGLRGREGSETLAGYIPNYGPEGYGISALGLDAEMFSGEAARRIRGRGISDNWFAETYMQIGLERNLALREGALTEGGQYDRYGMNVTEAISKLVTILSGIKGSGVSLDDFTRVQEKYDIQQQIMNSYMSRSDRPDYDVANTNLAAFSAVRGITQDSRVGSDYQSFQNMIQNPMNERMRALIYSSVADLFPETGGRMDLIDRKLRDPKNEGEIMQSVIQRITQQFGGTDTQMGYFAFKSLLPNIAPERIDEYINQLSNKGSLAGNILSGGGYDRGRAEELGRRNMMEWTKQSTEFKSDWTYGVKEIVNTLNYWGGLFFGSAKVPNANSLKSGGNN